jgi:hypothetical protein
MKWSLTSRRVRGRPVLEFAMVALTLSFGLSPLTSRAATLVLAPVADATLYEDSAATANGAGEVLVAGRTNQASGSRRRSLLRFDPSGLPDGAVISSVSLQLFLLAVTTAETNLSLHRATTPWTEGPADPGGTETTGAIAVSGDVTWRYASFDSSTWTTLGGDALAAPSATQSVGSTSGAYSWTSAELGLDVSAWAEDPTQNFGWLLRGDELAPQTAKRFASSDNPDPALRPALVIEYHVIPEPAIVALCGLGLPFLMWSRRLRVRDQT